MVGHDVWIGSDVQLGRGVKVGHGAVENVYRLQVMNAQERPRDLRIRVHGTEGLHLTSTDTLHLAPAEALQQVVTVRLDPAQASAHAGRVLPIHFSVGDAQGEHAETTDTGSTLLVPR